MAGPNGTALIDDFTRSDAATLGTGWSDMPSIGLPTHRIISNQAGLTTAYASNWRDVAVSADQEVYATLSTLPTLGANHLMGRLQSPDTGAEKAYMITIYDTQDWYLEKITAGFGSPTTLQTLGGVGNFTAGWKVAMSMVGTTIKAYKDSGAGWVQVGTDQTDSSVTGSGHIGLFTGNNTSTRWDDFGGGAVGGGGGSSAQGMMTMGVG